MSIPPTLSVLMTVYNGGRFLAPAIDSILAEPVEGLELVVVDNVSTDGSRDYLRRHPDPRLRLIENETNLGQTGALRRGFDYCRAPLVARLDADDLVEPGRFAAQMAVFAANPAVVLVGGQAQRIDADDRPLSRTDLPIDSDEIAGVMCVANPFVHSSVMFRRDAAVAAGGYPADFAIAQDFALWSALWRAGGRLVNLPATLCRLRLHGAQVTASALGDRELPETMRIITANQSWVLRDAVADPTTADVTARLLACPRLSRRARARLALTLASAARAPSWGRRAALLARALGLDPVAATVALGARLRARLAEPVL